MENLHGQPSPVPSDARLWPGEQPFTAFGQFGAGHLDLRVFDQDIWWVDINGTPHQIDEMPFDYQANVLMFLREHAGSYHRDTILRACVQAAGDALCGLEPLTGLDPDEISRMTSHEWLEQTPLVRKLRHVTGATAHRG